MIWESIFCKISKKKKNFRKKELALEKFLSWSNGSATKAYLRIFFFLNIEYSNVKIFVAIFRSQPLTNKPLSPLNSKN